MTLPNKLTLLRILAIPIMIFIYYLNALKVEIFLNITYTNFLIALVFLLASLTDLLDGQIARNTNQVTTFGKFADPLADKMLVFTAMLMLLDSNIIYMWVVIIIMVREFMVSGIRMVVVEKGRVVAASPLGKAKTVFTMTALFVLFLASSSEYVKMVGDFLIYGALGLTVISGFDYFWKNKRVILESF